MPALRRFFGSLLLLLALDAPAAADAVLPPGTPLTLEVLEPLLEPFLLPPAAEARRTLHIASPSLPLPNPARSHGVLRIMELRHHAQSGRFNGYLHVRLEGGEEAVLELAGQAVEMIEVPVLAAKISAETAFDEALMTTAWVPRERLPDDAVTDAGQLTGMEARRGLVAERPLRARDLRRRNLVRRGETVALTFKRGGLELRALARALEDGTTGDLIRLANLDTDRTVRARVVGRKQALAGDTWK